MDLVHALLILVYAWQDLPSVLLQNGVFFWLSFSANTHLCLHDFSFLIFDTQGQIFIVFNYKQCDKSFQLLRNSYDHFNTFSLKCFPITFLLALKTNVTSFQLKHIIKLSFFTIATKVMQ